MDILQILKLAHLTHQDDEGMVSAILTSQFNPEHAQKVTAILQASSLEQQLILSQTAFQEWPVTEDLPPGELIVGNVMEGDRTGSVFFLPLQTLTEHVGIFGQSGAGKTRLAYYLAEQLLELGIPVLFLDTENEFKNILTSAQDVLIFDFNTLSFNLFQPVNCSPTIWANHLKDLLRSTFYMRDGSLNLFNQIIFDLYKNGIPTLREFHTSLTRRKYHNFSRESAYCESLVNRFTTLIHLFSAQADIREETDWASLFTHSIVFRLEGLSDEMKIFFTSYLLTILLSLKEVTDRLEQVLVIDEAHRWFNKIQILRQDVTDGIGLQASRTLRKRGVGLLICDQVPSQLHPTILANTGLRFVFRTINGHCIHDLGAAMALTKTQENELPALPKRCAVTQYEGFKFLVQIPVLPPIRRLSEEELNQALDQSQAKFGFSHLEQNQPETDTSEKNTFADESFHMLDTIIQAESRGQFLTLGQLYAQMNFTRLEGDRIREDLESQGYLTTKPLKIKAGKGGIPRFIELLPPAYERAESKLNICLAKPRESVEHRATKQAIVRFYRAMDCDMHTERVLAGLRIDAVAVFQGKEIAIEVIFSNEELDILEKVRRLLELSFAKIILVCKTGGDIKKLQSRLSKTYAHELSSGRIDLQPAYTFFQSSTAKMNQHPQDLFHFMEQDNDGQ